MHSVDTHRLPVRVFLVSWLGFLLLSLAWCQRSRLGWDFDEGWSLSATRIRCGVPRPWVSITWHRSTGNPPDVESLPEGGAYRAGVRLSPFATLSALAVSALATFIVLGAFGLLTTPLTLIQSTMFAASSGFGIALGLVIPTHPNWIGAVLTMAGVPIVLVVTTWNVSKIRQVFLHAAVLGAFVGWAQQLVGLFGSGHAPTDARFSLTPTLMSALLVIAISLPAYTILLVRRSRKTRAMT